MVYFYYIMLVSLLQMHHLLDWFVAAVCSSHLWMMGLKNTKILGLIYYSMMKIVYIYLKINSMFIVSATTVADMVAS